MKTNKTALTIIGILFIAAQLLAFHGMSKVYVGLYPSSETLFYVNPSYGVSEFNVKEAFFAIEAGADRFNSSFEDLITEDEFRVSSVKQYTSAMIRESLGCSDGGSFGLFVYDTILTISYCFIGIIGVGLLYAAKIIERRAENQNNEEQSEENSN